MAGLVIVKFQVIAALPGDLSARFSPLAVVKLVAAQVSNPHSPLSKLLPTINPTFFPFPMMVQLCLDGIYTSRAEVVDVSDAAAETHTTATNTVPQIGAGADMKSNDAPKTPEGGADAVTALLAGAEAAEASDVVIKTHESCAAVAAAAQGVSEISKGDALKDNAEAINVVAKMEMAATTIQQIYYGTKEVDAALKIQEDNAVKEVDAFIKTQEGNAADAAAPQTEAKEADTLSDIPGGDAPKVNSASTQDFDALAKREMAIVTILRIYMGTKDAATVVKIQEFDAVPKLVEVDSAPFEAGNTATMIETRGCCCNYDTSHLPWIHC
jgi:hypothetical protein